ncbi:histidine kinase [Pycnococcus provasolii]
MAAAAAAAHVASGQQPPSAPPPSPLHSPSLASMAGVVADFELDRLGLCFRSDKALHAYKQRREGSLKGNVVLCMRVHGLLACIGLLVMIRALYKGNTVGIRDIRALASQTTFTGLHVGALVYMNSHVRVRLFKLAIHASILTWPCLLALEQLSRQMQTGEEIFIISPGLVFMFTNLLYGSFMYDRYILFLTQACIVGTAIIGVKMYAAFALSHEVVDPIELVTFDVAIFTATVLLMLPSAERTRRQLVLAELRLEKAKDDDAAERQLFMRRVLHDLKTPLGALLRAISTPNPDSRLAYILTELVRHQVQALNYSNDMPKVYTTINIQQHFARTVQIYEPLMEACEQSLALECFDSNDSSAVAIPVELLDRAVANLLSNASKFTLDRGKIALTVSLINVEGAEADERSELRVEVRDTGKGVPTDQRDSIWLAGHKLQSDAVGLGLGLPSVKLFAEGEGGRVWCTSNEVDGEGATIGFSVLCHVINKENQQSPINGVASHDGAAVEDVVIAMPPSPLTKFDEGDTRRQSRRGEQAREESTADCVDGWHILIIDNDEAQRVILERCARAEMMISDVTTADNGQDGLMKMERANFDVVLAEMNLPIMDGLTMFEKARNKDCLPKLARLMTFDDKLAAMMRDRCSFHILSKSLGLHAVIRRALVECTNPAQLCSPPAVVRVLLVDDDRMHIVNLRRDFNRLLSSTEVHCAYNGRKGLELLRRTSYDVLITDFNMPEMDGLSMLQAARKEGIAPPVCKLVTASTPMPLDALSKEGIMHLDDVYDKCDLSRDPVRDALSIIADGTNRLLPVSALLRNTSATNCRVCILLVDDNPTDLASLRSDFQDVLPSAEIHSARDGQEGLELLRSRSYDVVVTDLHMPVMDGVSMLEAARSEGIRPRVCKLLTASSVDLEWLTRESTGLSEEDIFEKWGANASYILRGFVYDVVQQLTNGSC